MSSRLNRFLLGYAALLSTAMAGYFIVGQVGAAQKPSFDEIDVKRVNVREEDGTLRMVISNTTRFPGIIVKGTERPHPNRRTAGVLFFNDEGTENGGLTFDGRKVDGKTVSTGHLSFDQYEQDQVLQITQHEEDGKRYAALVVQDRPDQSIDYAAVSAAMTMPDGPAKNAALTKLTPGLKGTPRMQIGKWKDRSSALYLHDAAGRPRLILQVTAEGAASIQFMDENMKVVRTVDATGEAVRK
jgi:hypothetical protein